jgi:hypothetical protein
VNWDEQFQRLLEAVTEAFSPAKVREVLHFVEVGEEALALDTFVAIVIEEAKALDPAACKVFEETAKMLDYDAYLEREDDEDLRTAVTLLRTACHEHPAAYAQGHAGL